MSEPLYRKSASELKAEYNKKFKSGLTVIFMDCKDYREKLPKVTVNETDIVILGSEYQIFNMKRSDTGPYWDHFWKELEIEIYREV